MKTFVDLEEEDYLILLYFTVEFCVTYVVLFLPFCPYNNPVKEASNWPRSLSKHIFVVGAVNNGHCR